MLARTPRSGFYFLGSGEQSVAEHICRVLYIGYVLAMMDKEADLSQVLQMCLLHDIGEARTSDLNYVHQKYTDVDEEQAVKDLAGTVPFGNRMLAVLEKYQQRSTREAKIAKDADNLEFLISVKEQVDTGNVRASSWMPNIAQRLVTENAQHLATEIMETDSDEWWFEDKDDDWWVNRRQKASEKY